MRKALIAFALLLVASVASADTIVISSVSGDFLNPLGGGGTVVITNGSTTSTIDWGGVNPPSGYTFLSQVPPPLNITIPPSPTNWFLLADFTHRNQPIPGNPITGVDLNVAMAMTIDATNVSATFGYHLTHDETPNAIPCPAFQLSGIPCDDRVQVSAPATGVFFVGGTLYTLQLAFINNAGAFVNEFVTTEGLNNTAGLYGRFTSDDVPIPEPASMLLLGTGLVGLGRAWRKRRS